MTRVALIHALRHSLPPIEDAFARLWPEARLANLLDDSLSADLARDGRLTPTMTERFLTLARYAAGTGADGILFTCSAFGPCIEAMIEEAATYGRLGLLASFAPTLASMPAEFPPGTRLVSAVAEGALAALNAGNIDEHDRLTAAAARAMGEVDAIALAQFSLARAAPLVAAAAGRPVLTTPDSAVRKLRRLLG